MIGPLATLYPLVVPGWRAAIRAMAQFIDPCQGIETAKDPFRLIGEGGQARAPQRAKHLPLQGAIQHEEHGCQKQHRHAPKIEAKQKYLVVKAELLEAFWPHADLQEERENSPLAAMQIACPRGVQHRGGVFFDAIFSFCVAKKSSWTALE